ncbi:conserved hypothetical protein [Xylella fastidiosa Temecula1]|uniref:Uncharacterized protein n=5 Tax=Xylella fastidiosa TaxID=2371 RepID=Q87E53_XYLFT|nr:conserved hypothetical protein [Xylella fastidiosa Temecula1]
MQPFYRFHIGTQHLYPKKTCPRHYSRYKVSKKVPDLKIQRKQRLYVGNILAIVKLLSLRYGRGIDSASVVWSRCVGDAPRNADRSIGDHRSDEYETMAYAFPWTTLTIPGIACMKRIQALVVLSLLFIANAQAQQGTLFCPQLPTTSKLHWDQNVGIGFLFCKASNEEGRMVLGVILTTRDPNIPMTRNHRAEKSQIGSEKFYWYKLDLGIKNTPSQENRRITVVTLGRKRYAQMWIDAQDEQELVMMQFVISKLDLESASLALLP